MRRGTTPAEGGWRSRRRWRRTGLLRGMCCIDMGQDGSDFNGAMARRRGHGCDRRHRCPGVDAGLVVGCGDDRHASTGSPTTVVDRPRALRPTTTLPDLTASDGLAASIRQFREDEAAGVIQIEMVRWPGGEGLVAVTSVRLDWPGFEPVSPTVRPVQVAGSAGRPAHPARCRELRDGRHPAVLARRRGGTVDPGDGTARTVKGTVARRRRRPRLNVWRRRSARSPDRRFRAPAWARSDPDGSYGGGFPRWSTRRDTSEAISVNRPTARGLLFVDWTTPPPTLPSDERQLEVPIVVTGAGRCDGHVERLEEDRCVPGIC